MGEWGFSAIGLGIGAAMLLPNLLLLVRPPEGGIPATADAGLAFTVLERAGQVGCLVLLAISASRFDQVSGWIVPLALCTLGYWALWGRYLARREFRLLFAPVWRIPVPMAVLPIAAFASAALWSGSPWLGIAVAVLAVGHLATSVAVARSLEADRANPVA